MGILFTLLGLLHVFGLIFGHVCRRELLKEWDFPGSDIQILFSPDAEHCQHLCTEHPSCIFFAFIGPECRVDKRHFHCFLKSTPSGQPYHQGHKQGTTAGFSLKPCNPEPKPCLSRVYPDVDFPEADYKTFFTTDHMECQRACTHDPGCQFFAFRTEHHPQIESRYKCYLKFSWTVPRTPIVVAKAGLISGFSYKMQTSQYGKTACQPRLFPGTDFPGHDIEVLPAAAPGQCQAFCSAHPRCTYFSYVSHHFKCYLKNNPHAMVPKAASGITSGLPARFCQEDDSWMRSTYNGIDFPHSDIRSFWIYSAVVCQKICTQTPNCQFYSFITSSHLCYLKRVITLPAPPKVIKMPNLVSGFSLRNCPIKK